MKALLGRRLPLVLGALGFAVVAVVAGFALSSQSEDSRSGPSNVTDPARFDIPTIDGTARVRLADFKGKPLVVNFFASWCGPCQKELPELAQVAKELTGRVQFVAVNSQEISAPAGVALARSKGLPEAGVTLGRDVGGRAGSLLHDALGAGGGMPINAFYDATGKLVYVARGAVFRDEMTAQIRQLFGVTL
jgi:thiol-disulfide isomerase/thioredoxin